MRCTSDDLRKMAFQIMESIGNPATRINSGQQWLLELADGKTAILKTASKGGLMVRTTSEDNDADIVGFNGDATHVLAAVNLSKGNTITAYLIPIAIVEAAYRRNNKEWTEQKPGRGSQTWVLQFGKNKYYNFYGGNMAEEWAEYVVGTLSMDASANSPKIVLNRARMEIAKAYGVTAEQVKISVDL